MNLNVGWHTCSNPTSGAPPRKLIQTSASAHRLRRNGIATACGVVFVLVALAIVAIEMNKGTLIIRSEQSNVPIRITQGNKTVRQLIVRQGEARTRIAAGEYVVEIDGPTDQIVIGDDHVSLHRGEQEVVNISVKETSESQFDEAEEQILGKINNPRIDWGTLKPNTGAIAVNTSSWDANTYVQVAPMVQTGSIASNPTELDQAEHRKPYQVFRDLAPGNYTLSLMKNAGPRHVRIRIQEVEISAGGRRQVEFPAAKGVVLRGRVVGMEARKLTSATVMLHRKDDQWKSKSLSYIEADEAVGVEQDGEFETIPLPEGWYKWSIYAYAPDDGQRFRGFRLPGYQLFGEVYIPATGVAEDLEIVIPADYQPNLELSRNLLAKPRYAGTCAGDRRHSRFACRIRRSTIRSPHHRGRSERIRPSRDGRETGEHGDACGG